ncbi:hypothetical protein [Bradyrhizobium genosp. P]|uniref:hypothetical protein n=1 Tax=Bradyrhizobium genosp. P TaxID=83641 RepID=UPI003CF282D8
MARVTKVSDGIPFDITTREGVANYHRGQIVAACAFSSQARAAPAVLVACKGWRQAGNHNQLTGT